jgi:MFS family permease
MSQIILIHDWRTSYLILGSTILFFTILSSQFLKGDPDRTGFQVSGKENRENRVLQPLSEGVSFKSAVYSWQFWLAMCMFCCFGFISFSIWVHIVPHAVELKISNISAASIISIMSAFSILGNFGLGGIGGDKLGNRKIIVFGFVLMIAALILLVIYKDLWILYIAAGLFGLSFGSMAASEPPIVARLFGLRSHGLILGFIGLGFTIGGSLGPVVAGYLFDFSGTYRMTFIICSIIGLIGLILSMSLRPLKSYHVQL